MVLLGKSENKCGTGLSIMSCHPESLQWRHNGHDIVSNHQPHDCLLNRLSDADQRKRQSSASLAFVRGIHRGPVNSPHKWSVTRKMFPWQKPKSRILRRFESQHAPKCNKMTQGTPMRDDVIKWKHFPRYWPFVRGIHRQRWITHTKASDAELWCFLSSVPESTIE